MVAGLWNPRNTGQNKTGGDGRRLIHTWESRGESSEWWRQGEGVVAAPPHDPLTPSCPPHLREHGASSRATVLAALRLQPIVRHAAPPEGGSSSIVRAFGSFDNEVKPKERDCRQNRPYPAPRVCRMRPRDAAKRKLVFVNWTSLAGPSTRMLVAKPFMSKQNG